MGLIRFAAERAHIGQKVKLMTIYIGGVHNADPSCIQFLNSSRT
jgi:hypothetical protein